MSVNQSNIEKYGSGVYTCLLVMGINFQSQLGLIFLCFIIFLFGGMTLTFKIIRKLFG